MLEVHCGIRSYLFVSYRSLSAMYVNKTLQSRVETSPRVDFGNHIPKSSVRWLATCQYSLHLSFDLNLLIVVSKCKREVSCALPTAFGDAIVKLCMKCSKALFGVLKT